MGDSEFKNGWGRAAGAMLLCWSLAMASAQGAEPAPGAGQGGRPPSATKVQRFDIWEYDVEGNSILDTEDVERAVYPFLGPKRTIKDVEKARKRLQGLYRNAGYPTVLVNIPEQDVVGGVVRLTVTQGKVEQVQVKGSRYFSLGRIRKALPSLAKGQVPYLPDVQKQLTALNKATPDRQVTPVLRAGSTPGTLDVVLKVKDKLPLHGRVALDNENSAGTKPLRLSASVSYDNLWQRQHSFSFQYQTAPQDTSQVQVLAGTYVMPLDGTDDKLAFYAVRSNSNVSTIGTLSVIGNGTIVGARAILPLTAANHYFQTLSLGVDYKNFRESVVLTGADTLNTPIHYLPFSVRYDANWLTDGGRTTFGVGAHFAFRGLGSRQIDFENKRIYSSSNYLYLRGDVNDTRDLPYGMRLLTRLQGQLADSPLISNEEFSAGGAGSVRGYYASQVLGDNSLAGSLELHSPVLSGGGVNAALGLRALAFVDGAKLQVKEPLAGQADGYVLSSAGLGMDMGPWRHLSGDVNVAWPFHTQGDIKARKPRVHFRMSYDF